MTGQMWLIIEFPDGVRGGRGRIQGTGPRQPLPSSGTAGWFDPHYQNCVLQQFQDCGAIEPHVELNWSHFSYVISRSTSRDLEVVRCFKRKTSDHFNAGLGSDDALNGMIMDPTLFRVLEDSTGRQP